MNCVRRGDELLPKIKCVRKYRHNWKANKIHSIHAMAFDTWMCRHKCVYSHTHTHTQQAYFISIKRNVNVNFWEYYFVVSFFLFHFCMHGICVWMVCSFVFELPFRHNICGPLKCTQSRKVLMKWVFLVTYVPDSMNLNEKNETSTQQHHPICATVNRETFILGFFHLRFFLSFFFSFFCLLPLSLVCVFFHSLRHFRDIYIYVCDDISHSHHH